MAMMASSGSFEVDADRVDVDPPPPFRYPPLMPSGTPGNHVKMPA